MLQSKNLIWLTMLVRFASVVIDKRLLQRQNEIPFTSRFITLLRYFYLCLLPRTQTEFKHVPNPPRREGSHWAVRSSGSHVSAAVLAGLWPSDTHVPGVLLPNLSCEACSPAFSSIYSS